MGDNKAENGAAKNGSAKSSDKKKSDATMVLPTPPDGGWGWMVVFGKLVLLHIILILSCSIALCIELLFHTL